MYYDKTLKNKIISFLKFAFIPLFAFAVVVIIPFILGVYMTFTNSTGTSISGEFVGLSNYIFVFKDEQFWISLAKTFEYTFWVLIFTNLLAFSLALLVTSGIKGQNVFRTGFFTPNLIGGVILGFIWQFIFTRILLFLGENFNIALFDSSWLVDPTKALWALIIVGVWQNSGYMMLIYISGFQNIPNSLIEAAGLDGASKMQILAKIKIPLMMQSFTISVFLTLKNAMMVYDTNLSLTKGGPFRKTELISMNVYNEAFVYQNYGPGQAKAIILFLIVATIAIAQVSIMKKKEVEA